MLSNKVIWWVSDQGNQEMTTDSNGMRLIPELSGEIFIFLKNPSSHKIKMCKIEFIFRKLLVLVTTVLGKN